MEECLSLKEVVTLDFIAAKITGNFTVSITWSGRTADSHDVCFNQGHMEGVLGCAPYAKTPAFVPKNVACTASDRDGIMRVVGQYLEQYGINNPQLIREAHAFDMLLDNGKKFNVFFTWDIRHEGWLLGCRDYLVSEPLLNIDIKQRAILLEYVKGYVEAAHRSELRKKESAKDLKAWFAMRNIRGQQVK